MKYLLVLNRFEIDKNKLREKIGNFYEDHGIIVDSIKFKDITEVNKIYILSNNWKKLNFKDFNQDILKAFNLVKGNNFFAKTKFFDKIPISSKSIIKKINSLMRKENISYKENGEIEFLAQFKRDKDIFYRVLVRENKLNQNKFDLSKFTIVLENPDSVIEISDFLRICWIFKLPLIIISKEDKKFLYLLNKAKKMTKGIPYEKLNLKILKELPMGFVKVGFSIKAKLNEKYLPKILENKKIALIFGDEKFGLTQKLRDECNFLVKLTDETKKPLRASQALSYVLGFYVRNL